MLNSAHILVIDDDPTILDLLFDILASSFHVCVESNSSQAVERVCHERFDLLILDLEMPVLDGFEVIHRVRDCPESAGIPVLVLSAHPDARAELKREPVQGCMEKPFAIDKLVGAVEQLLQRAGERQSAVLVA